MDGLQEAGPGGIGLDFLAQLGHMLVKGAGGAEIVNAPDRVEQPIAVESLVGMPVEVYNELELQSGELEGFTLPLGAILGLDCGTVIKYVHP